MTNFDIVFVLFLVGLWSYAFFHPRPIIVDEPDQEFRLGQGAWAKIWNNKVCTITPNEKWAKVIFAKPNNPSKSGHSTIIKEPTCFYIQNGEIIKSIENSINVVCSNKCA